MAGFPHILENLEDEWHSFWVTGKWEEKSREVLSFSRCYSASAVPHVTLTAYQISKDPSIHHLSIWLSIHPSSIYICISICLIYLYLSIHLQYLLGRSHHCPMICDVFLFTSGSKTWKKPGWAAPSLLWAEPWLLSLLRHGMLKC